MWNESDTGAPANDVADVDDERSVEVKPFVFYTQCAVQSLSFNKKDNIHIVLLTQSISLKNKIVSLIVSRNW